MVHSWRQRIERWVRRARGRTRHLHRADEATSEKTFPQLKSLDHRPIYVFVRTWNRPLYLWACLDSLYRNTRTPCRFVLMDNCSTDPLVDEVIAGFQRRRMFHAVHKMDRNHGANQSMLFLKYRADLGPYFALLDGDVTVEASDPDWLHRLLQIAEARPNLAVLGSHVDQGDFVDLAVAEQVFPAMDRERLAHLVKARSPERRLAPTTEEVIDPFNPPGRLLLVRTDAVAKIGLPVNSVALYRAAQAAGYDAGIATTVRHRHLSLLNLFDYPEYEFDQLWRYLREE